MAKTWIFRAQAIIFGCFALFSLILGPLFLFQIIHDAHNKPAPDAGLALTIISVPSVGLFALAVSNNLARRAPLIQLFREGATARKIGELSVDRFPFIPAMLRIAWAILSLQGFQQRTYVLPWDSFHEASVSGAPMGRTLMLFGAAYRLGGRTDLRAESREFLIFHEVDLKASWDEIAGAINYYCQDIDARNSLGSCDDEIDENPT